jgi:hypothetical protein
MNVVSVQIYSDHNTPWNRSKIDFPINIENTNWPGNGCGLCNQLFKLINTIAFNQGSDIYVDLFSMDYHKGNTICVSEILNLEEMRKNDFRVYDILDLDYNQDYIIKTYPGVYQLYHTNIDILAYIIKNLKFQDKYKKIAKNIIKNKGLSNKLINLAHLRIDEDYKNHMVATSGLTSYLNLIENYRSEIYSNFDKSIPLVLLLEETNHEFVKDLKKDYNVYIIEKSDVLQVDSSIEGREIFALIDMISANELNVDGFIGYEGSSFSITLKYLLNNKKSIILK